LATNSPPEEVVDEEISTGRLGSRGTEPPECPTKLGARWGSTPATLLLRQIQRAARHRHVAGTKWGAHEPLPRTIAKSAWTYRRTGKISPQRSQSTQQRILEIQSFSSVLSAISVVQIFVFGGLGDFAILLEPLPNVFDSLIASR